MILLPTFQTVSADYTFQLNVENQAANARVIYNVRNGCFSLYFTDGDGNEINSIKIVPNYPLLAARKGFTSLRGDFFVFNDGAPGETEITYDNFGNGFNLYYLTADEVEQWEVDNGLQ